MLDNFIPSVHIAFCYIIIGCSKGPSSEERKIHYENQSTNIYILHTYILQIHMYSPWRTWNFTVWIWKSSICTLEQKQHHWIGTSWNTFGSHCLHTEITIMNCNTFDIKVVSFLHLEFKKLLDLSKRLSMVSHEILHLTQILRNNSLKERYKYIFKMLQFLSSHPKSIYVSIENNTFHVLQTFEDLG